MNWCARFIAVLMVILGGTAIAAAQSVIELRASARVSEGAPVRVGDVAVLRGNEAEALAQVVVRKRARPAETIAVDDLRRAIDEHGRVNWGRLSLRGSTCMVMVGESRPAERSSQAAEPQRTVDPAGTVRAVVEARIAAMAQTNVQNLRLSYAAEDNDLLTMSTTGRTVEVTPTGMSDRLPLSIRVFEGERIIHSRTIRVGVEVRREVVIAAAARRRGEMIREDDVTTGVQWLGLAARPAVLEQVVSASPRMRVSAGQVVMVEDVAPPLVVNKGEVALVYCVNGSVVLTIRARAMGAGRDGELVEFQTLDNSRTFHARMDGRGRAVINMNEAM